MTDTPNSEHGDGRDARGRFAPGNPGGPGRPPGPAKALARKVRAAIEAGTEPTVVERAVRKLWNAAEQGDAAAFRAVCDRILGKPGAEPTEEQREELRRELLRDVRDALQAALQRDHAEALAVALAALEPIESCSPPPRVAVYL